MRSVTLDGPIRGSLQRGRQRGVIKGRRACGFAWIDQDIPYAFAIGIPIPEPPVLKRLCVHHPLVGKGINVVIHESLGSGVVLVRVLLWLLSQAGCAVNTESGKEQGDRAKF